MQADGQSDPGCRAKGVRRADGGEAPPNFSEFIRIAVSKGGEKYG